MVRAGGRPSIIAGAGRGGMNPQVYPSPDLSADRHLSLGRGGSQLLIRRGAVKVDIDRADLLTLYLNDVVSRQSEGVTRSGRTIH
jgi:hypothetical protein